MSTDLTPRDELRAKIEASERRIAQRTLADQAREAADAATEYAKANPLKVVGGAVVVGVLVGAMTKPGRRVARNTAGAVRGAASGAANSVTNAAKKRSSAFTSLIADAVIAYGIKLIDEAMSSARKGQDALEDVGDSASAKARELRREAGYIAGSAADKGRTVARRTRRRAERAVRDLTDRVSN